MANLSITTACNRDCTYCFARSARALVPARSTHMSPELFDQALDFLGQSGIDRVRLLGGEPTVHPNFPEMVDKALSRNLGILIFSNGLMPETAIRCIEDAPPEKVAVLLNVPDERSAPEPEIVRQKEILRRLGARATLSVNLHHAGVDPSFALRWIRDYGLAPRVRLGLAHPSLGRATSWLRPRQYRVVGSLLAAFIGQCKNQDVSIDFDCGFVPCMFPDGVLESIGRCAADVGLRCSPVLDILSDGQVVHCYPLAAIHREALAEHAGAGSLRRAFQQRFARYRPAGVLPECSDCAWKRQGDCTGGCLAAAMNRMQPAPWRVSPAQSRAPACPTSSSRGIWSIPYIDQPLRFWHRLREEFGAEIGSVYLPLPPEVVGSGRPVQPSEYTREVLESGIFPINVLVNPVVLQKPLDVVAPRVIGMLRTWRDRYGIAGATVSNLILAARIREALPDLQLVASTLLEIATPLQAQMASDIFDVLVPATRIMRDRSALRALRAAFPGRLRLIVNEACLPGCPYRTQHFYEMASGCSNPESLCRNLLDRKPWLRLTGAWVLPQHLHLYDGLYDELKLAGRVTLSDPANYRRVLRAYMTRSELQPHEIGGGPASVNWPARIPEEYYLHMLNCGQVCDSCQRCHDVAEEHSSLAGIEA